MTVSTISSRSFVSKQIGNASMPANCRNSIALPSITGKRAERTDIAQTEHGGAVGNDGDASFA